jgi:hypothetical protein
MGERSKAVDGVDRRAGRFPTMYGGRLRRECVGGRFLPAATMIWEGRRLDSSVMAEGMPKGWPSPSSPSAEVTGADEDSLQMELDSARSFSTTLYSLSPLDSFLSRRLLSAMESQILEEEGMAMGCWPRRTEEVYES